MEKAVTAKVESDPIDVPNSPSRFRACWSVVPKSPCLRCRRFVEHAIGGERGQEVQRDPGQETPCDNCRPEPGVSCLLRNLRLQTLRP